MMVDMPDVKCGVPKPNSRTGSVMPNSPHTNAYGAKPSSSAPETMKSGHTRCDAMTTPAHTITPRCSFEQGAFTLPENVTKHAQLMAAPKPHTSPSGS